MRAETIGKFLSGVFCAALLVSCTTPGHPATRATGPHQGSPLPPGEHRWPADYEFALTDALNPEPTEQSDDLVAIVRSDSTLVWRTHEPSAAVLMVSLVEDSSHFAPFRDRAYDTGEAYIWVTAAPQLRRTCQAPGFLGPDPKMRLRQLLGLTPKTRVEAMVSLWVDVDDLFRPTPDPSIRSNTAGLDMPPDVDPAHRAWFNQLRAAQYFQWGTHNAYPWTQLGYTYDWSPGAPEEGLSEFVIRQGAQVDVQSIASITEYCTP